MNSSQRRPHIGFIVDHPRRDLGGAAMVARAAARAGCIVSLIPLYEQGVDVPLLGLDGLITTFARPANQALVATYSRLGIPVWVLDTEGGVLADNGPNTPHKLAAFIRDSGFADTLAGYMFWGPLLRDAFAADAALGEDRMVVTGCPRFDFAAPRFRALLRYDCENFVLVNTNFSSVNSRFGNGGVDRDAMEKAGWGPAYVDGLIEDGRAILARLIDTVCQLARDYPEQLFLVRPHPFERAETYASAFDGLGNVHVRGEGNVLNVIANCRCVLHLNCGTAIEAIMLNKLPIALDFISTPRMRTHSSLPGRVSLEVNDYQTLKQTLEGLPALTATFDFASRYALHIAPYFFENDGLAADRVVQAALAAVPSRPVRRSLSTAMCGSHFKPTLAQMGQGAASVIFGSRATAAVRSSLQRHRVQKQFDVEEVRRVLGAITGHLDEPALEVSWQRHPWSGARLASVRVCDPAATSVGHAGAKPC
ncbi:MAG TPA: surface carbohydrate biosynthesis protein [Sphingomicrobium sp.]|nr:surface carbohydrate biosynthesis protein [Sphingomicrobium sp.]